MKDNTSKEEEGQGGQGKGRDGEKNGREEIKGMLP